MYNKYRMVSFVLACFFLASPSSQALSPSDITNKIRKTVEEYWVDATVTVATLSGFAYWHRRYLLKAEATVKPLTPVDSWGSFGGRTPKKPTSGNDADDEGGEDWPPLKPPEDYPPVPFNFGSAAGVFAGFTRFDLDRALDGYAETRASQPTIVVTPPVDESVTHELMTFRRRAYDAQTLELFGQAEPRGRRVRQPLPWEWIERPLGVVVFPGQLFEVEITPGVFVPMTWEGFVVAMTLLMTQPSQPREDQFTRGRVEELDPDRD